MKAIEAVLLEFFRNANRGVGVRHRVVAVELVERGRFYLNFHCSDDEPLDNTARHQQNQRKLQSRHRESQQETTGL